MSYPQKMDRDEGVAEAVLVPEIGQIRSGLSIYTPVPQDLANLRSPALILGSEFHQMLQISLAPGDIITAEPGTMVMMSGDLLPHVDTGTCEQACTRCCCAGENFFRLVFENKTGTHQFLSLGPAKPGKIIPLPLEKHRGMTLTAGSFFAAYGKDWLFKLKLAPNVATGCCGGQGFVLTEIGGEGTVFISASGTVEELKLEAGEKLVVDQSSLVGFDKSVTYDVRMVQGCLTCCCGGMGLFNAVLTGPGTVIVQSLPMSRLARALRMVAGGGGGANNNSGNAGTA